MSYTGKSPTFTKVIVGNVEIEGETIYIGDRTANGSVRLVQGVGYLSIEIRVAGDWVEKDRINQ